MLIHKKGEDSYFDPHLINCLMDTKNKQAHNDVIDILQRYSENERTSGLPKLKDSRQATLLHYAAEHGNTDIVQYLFDCKCDIDSQDELGNTPLILAVIGKHEEIIEILLKADADIHLTNSQGTSALRIIFEHRMSYNILKKFFRFVTWQKIIEHITPDELSDEVLTKITSCPRTLVQLESAELLKNLLDREVIAANYSDKVTGEFLLHTAIIVRNLEIIKLLIEYGADVDAFDSKNRTPLSQVYGGYHPNFEGNVKMFKILMSKATLLTTSDGYGFMQAAATFQYGHCEAVEIILKNNIDFYATDEKKHTVVHYLVRNENIDLFKLMQGRKFNVNAKNITGYTPLHYATEAKSLNAMRFCLENGADVNEINDSGETALSIIIKNYRNATGKQFLELVLQYGADPKLLVKEKSCKEQLVHELEKMIEEFGADFSYTNFARSRLEKAIKLEELKEKIAADIYRLSSLKSNASQSVPEIIVEYLSKLDMENLKSVCDE